MLLMPSQANLSDVLSACAVRVLLMLLRHVIMRAVQSSIPILSACAASFRLFREDVTACFLFIRRCARCLFEDSGPRPRAAATTQKPFIAEGAAGAALSQSHV